MSVLPLFPPLHISAEGGGDSGTLSFEEINDKLSVFVPAPTDPDAGDYDANSLAAADYIAALNFSVGVLHQSDYSQICETGTIFSEEVFFRYGFQSAFCRLISEMDKAEQRLWVTENEQLTDEAMEILIENLVSPRTTCHGAVKRSRNLFQHFCFASCNNKSAA